MYKHILCPLDLSEDSLKAIRHSFNIAQRYEGSIIFLNASSKLLDDDEELMLRVSVSDFHKEEEEATSQIRTIIENRLHKDNIEKISKNIPYSIHVIPSKEHCGRSILNFAELNNIDLIVVTTHGHGMAYQLLIGSTAEYIIHHAHCPVLVVHRDD